MLLAFEGDSQTLGSAPNYPTQVTQKMTMPQRSVNNGVGGTALAAMQVRSTANLDPLVRPENTENVCLIWGGTNNMAVDDDGTATYNLLVSYCNARRAAGFKVVVVTALSRSEVGCSPAYNARRAVFNTLVRANWSQFADALADIASDSILGVDGAETNATYFTNDLVHLNPTGYGVVASYVYPALVTIGVR